MALRDLPQASFGNELRVEHLSKRFITSGTDVSQALSDVTFQVEQGEFVGIVGPSGCGKSTLLSIIAGLEYATEGRVMIGHMPVTGPTSDLGIAFQRDCLLEWRTVLRNITVQADLRGWKHRSLDDAAKMLLGVVGLSAYENSYPKELSGGMRQRVALCRALVHSPSILLLDEPFGAVDAMTREQLNADVSSISNKAGVTTILVTHDINEAVFMCSRIVVLSKAPGRIVGTVNVDAPVPRNTSFRETQDFLTKTVEVRKLLADDFTDA